MRETCAFCGKLIPEERRHTRVKYCSEACLRHAEAQQKMSVIADRATRINRVAQDVYLAYGARCAICGWQATPELLTHKGKTQFAHGNEIHHIIPVSEGGTEAPDNVILLCPNHHKQADLGIITAEQLRPYVVNFKEKAKEISQSLRANSHCEEIVSNAIFSRMRQNVDTEH